MGDRAGRLRGRISDGEEGGVLGTAGEAALPAGHAKVLGAGRPTLKPVWPRVSVE